MRNDSYLRGMPSRSIEQWGDHNAMMHDRGRASARADAAERARPAHERSIMSRATADPREALRQAVGRGRDSLAALSRMLGHGDGYLGRFIDHGVPKALAPDDHRRLADFFGLTERELGIRDLWCDRR